MAPIYDGAKSWGLYGEALVTTAPCCEAFLQQGIVEAVLPLVNGANWFGSKQLSASSDAVGLSSRSSGTRRGSWEVTSAKEHVALADAPCLPMILGRPS